MSQPQRTSLTIGRLPDNDVVVPLDMVSGHHARLERDGERVFLIDNDSRNGTAVNDPRKKIRRVEIHPGDSVFLGTHMMPARELFAALFPDAHDSGDGRAARSEAAPGKAPREAAVAPKGAAERSFRGLA